MSLAKAAAAKGNAQVLDALLRAWRKQRHPRLAEVIDRVNAQIAPAPVVGKTHGETLAACIKLCASKTPLAIGRVLATPWPVTLDAAQSLVDALAEVPDDPRVASALATQIELATIDTGPSTGMWRTIFGCISRLRDVRVLPTLARASTRTIRGRVRDSYRQWARDEKEVLERLVLPSLSGADLEALTVLESRYPAPRLDTSEGEVLLAAIDAAPDDLGARAVYADWLLQKNDPRGELISLQLNEPSHPRIAKLIETHWKTWLAPIRDCLERAPNFERGFPIAGVVWPQPETDVLSALERTEWRTFERLSWNVPAVPKLTMLRHPNFSRMRTFDSDVSIDELVTIIDAGIPLKGLRVPRDAEDFSYQRLPTLEQLTIYGNQVERVAHLLPRLRELAVVSPDLSPVAAKIIEASGVQVVTFEGARLSRDRGEKHFSRIAVPRNVKPQVLASLRHFTLPVRD